MLWVYYFKSSNNLFRSPKGGSERLGNFPEVPQPTHTPACLTLKDMFFPPGLLGQTSTAPDLLPVFQMGVFPGLALLPPKFVHSFRAIISQPLSPSPHVLINLQSKGSFVSYPSPQLQTPFPKTPPPRLHLSIPGASLPSFLLPWITPPWCAASRLAKCFHRHHYLTRPFNGFTQQGTGEPLLQPTHCMHECWRASDTGVQTHWRLCPGT